MKILIIFTVIFFSPSLLSLEYDCKLKIHVKNNSVTDPNVIDGIPYDEWIDLENYDVLFLDQGNQLSMIILEEEFIENDYPPIEFYEVKETNRYIFANENLQFNNNDFHSIIFDQKFKMLTYMYYSEYGISIYEGFCN